MLVMLPLQRTNVQLSSADWATLLSGAALWALALYIPLSAPLARLEAELISTSLSETNQTTILVLSSLLLAASVGVVIQLLMSWALGPSWGASLGLMAVLSGAFWSLASRADGNGSGSSKR